MPNLAFPYDERLPAKLPELPLDPPIPRNVSFKFWSPIIELRFRGTTAGRVKVPKTPMDKNSLFSFPKDDIRASRQILRVEPISVSQAKN